MHSYPTSSAATIRLIGATTENPSFEIIAALLSRCRVYTLVGADRGADHLAAAARARRTQNADSGSTGVEADDEAL